MFSISIWLLPINALLLQTVTLFPDIPRQKKSGITLRKVDSSDLPDFDTAEPMNDCIDDEDGIGFIIDPTIMANLPEVYFPNIPYPIVLTEHLKHLPKTNFHIEQYFLINHQRLVKNNICPIWKQWEFEESGAFKIKLMWSEDTFFIITNDDKPSCEVIIWIAPYQYPVGRASFLRCAN